MSLICALDSYVERTGISWRELGRLTGLDHSTFSKWKAGKSRPTFDNACKIERATKGEVTADQIISDALSAERKKQSRKRAAR